MSRPCSSNEAWDRACSSLLVLDRSRRRERGRPGTSSAIAAAIGALLMTTHAGDAGRASGSSVSSSSVSSSSVSSSSRSSSRSISSRLGLGRPQDRGTFVFVQQSDRTSPWRRRDTSSSSSTSKRGGSVWRRCGCSPPWHRQQQRAAGREHPLGRDARAPLFAVERDAAATASAAAAAAAAAATAAAPAGASQEMAPLHQQQHGSVLAAVEEEGQLDDAPAHKQRRQQWNGQTEGLSLTAARRRRRELELSWLEDPGRDLPFEFADLHNAMNLPCSIQLVPRAERRSIVYVDGREARSRRDRQYTAATIPGAGGSKQNPARIATATAAVATAVTIGDRIRREVGGVGAGGGGGDGGTGEVRKGRGVGSGSSSSSSRGGGAPPVAEAGAGAGAEAAKGREADVVDLGGDERRYGDAIRLVGEMGIDKPAYLQVQEGRDGRSDALLVSQFGFTRGGAVSRVDLDPTPRLPRLFAGQVGGADQGRGGAVGVGGGLLSGRTLPRLTETWAGPLLWPNEVNQVPAEALVRLTQGMGAELQYLARTNSSSNNNNSRAEQDSGDAGARTALCFESEQFSLLRQESDKFDDSDGSRLPRSQAAELPEPGTAVAVAAAAAATGPAVPNPSREEPQLEQEQEQEEEGYARAAMPGWDGPLPEHGAVLIADGFLVPGKADGGVYLVVPTAAEEKGFTVDSGGGEERGAGAAERIVRLTRPKRGWFYHKAVWLVLPGGKKVVLTARVHKPLFGQAEGELVLLEMPRVNHPLSEQNLPWREKVLVSGPDVMFDVVDLDPDDMTVQVICAEFFGGKVTMHSLWGGGSLPGSRPSVTMSWVLDSNAGSAYSITAADLRGGSPGGRPTHFLVTLHESSFNTYSFFAGVGGGGGSWNSDSAGDARLPFEVEPGSVGAAGMRPGSGSSGPAVDARGSSTMSRRGGRRGGVVAGGPKERRWQLRPKGGVNGAGGSLVAYEIPEDWRSLPRFYPAPGWLRVTIASGFRVRGISINPGTPGFPYVFHPHRSMEGKHRPYIAIAGDCSQSAYVLRPTEAKQEEAEEELGSWEREPAPVAYEIACAIEVPGTVGSLAVGYGPLLGEYDAVDGVLGMELELEPEPPLRPPLTVAAAASAAAAAAAASRSAPSLPASSLSEEEERRRRRRSSDGWAKLFVPNYDGNKIYVFSMEPGPEL